MSISTANVRKDNVKRVEKDERTEKHVESLCKYKSWCNGLGHTRSMLRVSIRPEIQIVIHSHFSVLQGYYYD